MFLSESVQRASVPFKKKKKKGGYIGFIVISRSSNVVAPTSLLSPLSYFK
jgi:hypothetical protein